MVAVIRKDSKVVEEQATDLIEGCELVQKNLNTIVIGLRWWR